MLPYLLMLTTVSAPALVAPRRVGVSLLAVAVLFALMIGFRFQVGPDWDSYIHMYNAEGRLNVLADLTEEEIGFKLLMLFANTIGGGIILVNVISGFVFTFGVFSFARRCLEPFIAAAIATPYLVIVVSMSATRQALSIGIILYLLSSWKNKRTFSRILYILSASLFHFSAFFFIIFVALGSRLPSGARFLATTGLLLASFPFVMTASRVDVYEERYLGSATTAEGALMHVALVALPALAYLLARSRWRERLGTSPLLDNLAVVAVALLPATLFVPIPADRMSLYFWPVAMYVGSGWPALIDNPIARMGFRIFVSVICYVLLVGWLVFANHSKAYLPYQNYLLQPENVRLLRR